MLCQEKGCIYPCAAGNTRCVQHVRDRQVVSSHSPILQSAPAGLSDERISHEVNASSAVTSPIPPLRLHDVAPTNGNGNGHHKPVASTPLPRRSGNNHLDPKKRLHAEKEFLEGGSVSHVVRDVGIAKITALGIRDEMKAAGTLPEKCACGRENGHRGWCKGRLAKSPARQDLLKQLHMKNTKAPVSDRLKEKIALAAPLRDAAGRKTTEGLLEFLHERRARFEEGIAQCDDAIKSVEIVIALSNELFPLKS